MKWIDINEIVFSLIDNYPENDPTYILFTDLHTMVVDLDLFDDDPNRSNEKILEAIQMTWLDEID